MTDTATATALEPVSRRFTSQGLDLHYLDWGNADAPTVIFLHGSSDHARSWDWTARRLADVFHVVAMDLRGHGDSAWSPDAAYLSPYHSLDLAELVDTIGKDRVKLVGHSFGGNACWRFSAMYPDRVEKLIVVDGLGPSPSAIANWETIGPVARLREWADKRRDPRTGSQRRFATVEEMIERMAKANPHLTPEQAHHLGLHGARRHADGWSWKHDPRFAIFAPEDFAIHGEEFWKKIAIPTLIFHGDKSWNSNPEEDGRARHFADRRTIVYEDAGHWLHHDRLDDFVAEVAAFL